MEPTTQALIAKADIDGETRRVNMVLPKDASPAQIFQSIRTNVAQVFEMEEAMLPALKYKDDEGDLCTLVGGSVDDMLQLFNGRALRLFATTAPAAGGVGKKKRKDGQEKLSGPERGVKRGTYEHQPSYFEGKAAKQRLEAETAKNNAAKNDAEAAKQRLEARQKQLKAQADLEVERRESADSTEEALEQNAKDIEQLRNELAQESEKLAQAEESNRAEIEKNIKLLQEIQRFAEERNRTNLLIAKAEQDRVADRQRAQADREEQQAELAQAEDSGKAELRNAILRSEEKQKEKDQQKEKEMDALKEKVAALEQARTLLADKCLQNRGQLTAPLLEVLLRNPRIPFFRRR